MRKNGSEERPAYLRKIKGRFLRILNVKCNINIFWQYLRINSGFNSGLRLSCTYCWGATWKREKWYEEEGTPEEFHTRESVLGTVPALLWANSLENQRIFKGPRKCWKQVLELSTWGRMWTFCPPVFPRGDWSPIVPMRKHLCISEWPLCITVCDK